MRFYRETDCVSAQVQAVGASLQVGSTIWGVAPESWFKAGGRRRGASAFVARLIIAAPESHNGQRVLFELSTRWFKLQRLSATLA